jgi:oligopeptide/dipeptide ABC transporter ATP-binding protein
MYLGLICEIGDLQQVYRNPQHPYTKALLAAVPVPDPPARRKAPMPKGEIPSPINPPPGCRFHPRCPVAMDTCSAKVPSLQPVPGDEGHFIACYK